MVTCGARQICAGENVHAPRNCWPLLSSAKDVVQAKAMYTHFIATNTFVAPTSLWATTKELAATPVVEKKTLPNEGVKVAVKDDASSTVPIQRTPNTGVPQPQQPKKNEPVKQFINVQEEEDDGSNDAMETTMTE